MTESMGNERRPPRAVFTRKLRKICERLDAESHFNITKHHRWLRKTVTSHVEICDLWVVGSYARGAHECGDLDVLVRVQSEGPRPAPGEIAAEAFGHMTDVRMYEGTPEENSSGVPFPEAVHLWRSGIDWRLALSSIKEDLNAKRFARSTDAIPLRTEQLYAEVEDLERLVELRQHGVLEWRFVPLHSKPLPGELSDTERRVAHLAQFWGKKTHELLPVLIAYMRQWALPLTRLEEESGRRELDIGGAVIGLGRPRVLYEQLDDITHSRVVVIPHRSRRGPNGIWEIRRGPQHPLELAAATLGAYVEVDEADTPCSCLYVGKAGYPQAPGIDLFATEKRAMETVRQEQRPPPFALRHVRGSELLDLISCADVVDICYGDEDATTLALRRNGVTALASDLSVGLSDTEAVLATLKQHLSVRAVNPTGA